MYNDATDMSTIEKIEAYRDSLRQRDVTKAIAWLFATAWRFTDDCFEELLHERFPYLNDDDRAAIRDRRASMVEKHDADIFAA